MRDINILTRSQPIKASPQFVNDKITDASKDASRIHMTLSLLSQRGFDAEKLLDLIKQFSESIKTGLQYVEDENIRLTIIQKLANLLDTALRMIAIYNQNGCKEDDMTGTLRVQLGDEMLSIIDVLQHCLERAAILCNCCNQPITGKYVSVENQSFHDECFRCVHCNCIPKLFYNKDGSIYCQNCYNDVFLDKCKRCARPITPGEEFLDVKNLKFHNNCFTCATCFTPLPTSGFGFAGNEIYCSQHSYY